MGQDKLYIKSDLVVPHPHFVTEKNQLLSPLHKCLFILVSNNIDGKYCKAGE